MILSSVYLEYSLRSEFPFFFFFLCVFQGYKFSVSHLPLSHSVLIHVLCITAHNFSLINTSYCVSPNTVLLHSYLSIQSHWFSAFNGKRPPRLNPWTTRHPRRVRTPVMHSPLAPHIHLSPDMLLYCSPPKKKKPTKMHTSEILTALRPQSLATLTECWALGCLANLPQVPTPACEMSPAQGPFFLFIPLRKTSLRQ